MNRRSFFARLTQMAGLIALAPRLAFKSPDLTVYRCEFPPLEIHQLESKLYDAFGCHISTVKIYLENFHSEPSKPPAHIPRHGDS